MEQLLLQTGIDIPFFSVGLSEFLFLALCSLAGGAFGAYIGALPAFVFTGFLTFTGGLLTYAQSAINSAIPSGEALALGVTGTLGFGAVFGPHVSFVGGVIASTYVGKKYPETAPDGWDLHPGKVITEAHDTAKIDVILVGAVGGLCGWLFVQIFGAIGLGLPIDAIAFAVALVPLAARPVFGYPLIGKEPGDGWLDVGPFERGEQEPVTDRDGKPMADGGVTQLKTGVWLGHQYKWSAVTVLGVFGGAIGAYLWVFTGSFFLGYGISALSLLFLNLGVAKIPVTHHITLLGSVGGAVGAEMYSGEIAASFGTEAAIAALVGGVILGTISAVVGEIGERILYMHGGTHIDPPAIAIALTMLIPFVLFALDITAASGYLGL